MTNPDSMVLISGMPDPAAMYMTLPAGDASPSLFVELASAAGKALLVSIVADELKMPNSSAKPTYIPNLDA